MSFDIQFKETELSDSVTLDYNEFKARIRRGQIGPKSMVCDRVLTGNDWWPIDDLNVFHNHSPVQHPPGTRLQKKREVSEYWNARRERSWALLGSYIDGDLVDRSFQLTPLAVVMGGTNSRGATRLYVFRTFEPERIFTFLFQSEIIQIEVRQGRTSLWSSLPQVASANDVMEEFSGPPFDPAQMHRASAGIRYERAPEPFNQWNSVVEGSLLASSCSSRTTDGTTFKHEVLLPTESFVRDWRNPRAPEHDPQIKLLTAYHDCIVAVGLGRFWRGRSPELSDKDKS